MGAKEMVHINIKCEIVKDKKKKFEKIYYEVLVWEKNSWLVLIIK